MENLTKRKAICILETSIKASLKTLNERNINRKYLSKLMSMKITTPFFFHGTRIYASFQLKFNNEYELYISDGYFLSEYIGDNFKIKSVDAGEACCN